MPPRPDNDSRARQLRRANAAVINAIEKIGRATVQMSSSPSPVRSSTTELNESSSAAISPPKRLDTRSATRNAGIIISAESTIGTSMAALLRGNPGLSQFINLCAAAIA